MAKNIISLALLKTCSYARAFYLRIVMKFSAYKWQNFAEFLHFPVRLVIKFTARWVFDYNTVLLLDISIIFRPRVRIAFDEMADMFDRRGGIGVTAITIALSLRTRTYL